MNKRDMGSSAIQINWRIDEWFPQLSPAIRAQLKHFHTELLRHNKSNSLVPVKTISGCDAVHFCDSVLASFSIMNSGNIDELFDFGSGNGFPGLVFGILFPQVKVHLVEFDARRAECLKDIIKKVGVQNTDVLIRKVEDLDGMSAKVCVSRGFGTISKTLLSARKAVPKGGRIFHLKGEEWAREIVEIPTQLCSFWHPSLFSEYKLPVGSEKLAIVLTQKIVD